MPTLSRYLIIILALIVTPVFAGTASEQSVKQLLESTDAHKLLDQITADMDNMMKTNMQRSLQGKSITPKQQQIIEDMQHKEVALIKQEMTWEKLEPLYIKVYQDAFTQEEIDGILAFYGTPAGQALIKKMPDVLKKSTMEMQTRMNALVPQLQKIQQDAFNELKAQTQTQTKTPHKK